jgi:hypothetical protein
VARQKLSDSDVARLRELWSEGWSAPDLAAEFGVSRQHVGRIVREEQRPVVAGLGVDLRAGAAEAVERLVASVDVDADGAVVAATARALASKLDACAASESAAAAAAAPRIAAELVDVVGRLRLAQSRPSRIDELRRQRDARRTGLTSSGKAT